MAWRSAWAKWFTSQSLANSLHPDEALTMRAAASLVQDALTNSQLEVRGRRPGQLDYEPIPRTHWRSSGLHMIPDGMSLWKMILIPRGGAEITPDGKVIGRDQDAVQRTDQLATYDSLIVNARQRRHQNRQGIEAFTRCNECDGSKTRSIVEYAGMKV